MGEMNIRKKITAISNSILILILVLILYIVFLFGALDTGSNILRSARIAYHELTEEIEKGNFSALDSYQGMYIKNDGYVIKSTISAYQEGTYASLIRFSSVAEITREGGKKFYVTPVLKNKTQVGTLLVELKNQKTSVLAVYGVLPFLPPFFLLIAIFVLLMVQKRILKKDIFDPVNELLDITRNIRNNDFETRLAYDDTGEIGSLCHEVEGLRDELAFAKKSGEKLKKDEKELLACISHDLKTPLASVSGYVEGIRNRVVTRQEEVDRYLDIVIQKVTLISRLMDDILEQSKTELNEFPVILTEVYAKELFGEIFSDLSMDILKAGFEFSCQEVPDVMVYADRHRLFQVLQNITSNAMKYTQKGGFIHIDLEICEKELVLSVRDNGRGIGVNDQPFIFEKFYRGDKDRNMDIPGSGLGLAISKYIVECHGGNIECDSILGEGTVIRFSIRLC